MKNHEWTRLTLTTTLALSLLCAIPAQAGPHCKGEVLNPKNPDVIRAVEDYALLQAIEEARARLNWDKSKEANIHSWDNYMRHVVEGLKGPRDKLAEVVLWAGTTAYNRAEVKRLWKHRQSSPQHVYDINRKAYKDAVETYARSMFAPAGQEQQWFDIFMEARHKAHKEATDLIKHCKKHKIPINIGVASPMGFRAKGSLNNPPSYLKPGNMLFGARNFQLLKMTMDTNASAQGKAREWVRQETLTMGFPPVKAQRCLDKTSWEYVGFDAMERQFVKDQFSLAAAVRCAARGRIRNIGTTSRMDACRFAQKLLKHCFRKWRPDRARCKRRAPQPPTPPVKAVAPPGGGYWKLVKTMSKERKQGKHQCYKYSGSGGEGSATYTIHNICVKPGTKYSGTVTWRKPPGVLRPGQEIEITGNAATSAFDSRFSQGTHLSVKADFPSVPCGYRHTMGIPIGHIAASSNHPKKSSLKAKFKVRWKGPYGIAKDGTFGIFFCSPGHDHMYLYRWTPEK